MVPIAIALVPAPLVVVQTKVQWIAPRRVYVGGIKPLQFDPCIGSSELPVSFLRAVVSVCFPRQYCGRHG